MNINDTVLLKVPPFNVVSAIEEAAKKGHAFNPVTPKEREAFEDRLTGPLYLGGSVIITAEELSWALRKGYLRSAFYGTTAKVGELEEWIRPRVRYVITPKGVSTKLWF